MNVDDGITMYSIKNINAGNRNNALWLWIAEIKDIHKIKAST